MPININANISSLVAQHSFNKATNGLNKTMLQLSTGYKINKASDNPADTAIAVAFTNQIRGGDKAKANIQDGINLLQTAESGMEVNLEHIQRMRELCLQAANGVNGTESKSALLLEMKQMLAEIDSQASAVNFNEITLLDGSVSSLRLQTGPGFDPGANSIDIASALTNMKISAGGLNIELNVTTGAASGSSINIDDWDSDAIMDYIDQLDAAASKILADRSQVGAFSQRLNGMYDSLIAKGDNMTQARSRLIDLDYAQSGSDLVKYQILQQFTTSVLSQANQSPQLALSLLQ